MMSTLKAVALTIAMSLVLSALMAETALATTHTIKSASKSGTTYLTAEAAGGEAGIQVVETTTGEHVAIVCNQMKFKSSFAGESTKEITGEPVFSECWWEKTKSGATSTKETEIASTATFVTSGCHFRFKAETTAGNPTGGEHATLDVVNKENCEHLQTTVTALKLRCFEVATEQSVHGIRYETVAGSLETLKMKITAHGLKSTTINSVACPTKSGETEVHDNTSYLGDLTLKGYKDAAHTEQVNLTVE
jgi:hypothetical protein